MFQIRISTVSQFSPTRNSKSNTSLQIKCSTPKTEESTHKTNIPPGKQQQKSLKRKKYIIFVIALLKQRQTGDENEVGLLDREKEDVEAVLVAERDQGGASSGHELRQTSCLLINVIAKSCTRSASRCNRRTQDKQFLNVWTVASDIKLPGLI